MTTETEEREQTAEQQSQEERDADAAFAAGFDKKRGSKQQGDDTQRGSESDTEGGDGIQTQTESGTKAAEQSTAETDAEKKAREDEEARAAAEKQWEGVPAVVRERLEALGALPDRLRNIEGNIGGLKSQITSALATAKSAAEKRGGDAPTEKQVEAALANADAWKQLKVDYPDWAGPVEAEFASIRAELGKAAKPVDVDGLKKEVSESVDTRIAEVVDVAEERAYLRLKHPDWRQIAKSDEFVAWRKEQAADVQKLCASPSADDAIEVFDTFKADRQKRATDAAAQAAERTRREKRLEGGLTPKGTTGDTRTTINDDEAFERGFKRRQGK